MPGLTKRVVNDLGLITKAVDERYHGATWCNVDPAFDPVRDDPRFHDLLRRMNLEP